MTTIERPSGSSDDAPDLRGEAVATVLRRSVEGAPRWIAVDGESMGAAIPAHSRVLVGPATRPRRGEIWAFCLPDATIVVHRCRRGLDGRWQFQGDAQGWPDEPVGAPLLIGRVGAVEVGERTRRLGRWALVRDRALLDVAAIGRRLRRGRHHVVGGGEDEIGCCPSSSTGG